MSSYYVLAITAVIILAVASEEPRLPYHPKWNLHFFNDRLNSGALFGFSIAYYKSHNRLIVGAPKISQTGGAFTCNVTDEAPNCQELVVELGEDELAVRKHDFWLGATVNAGKDFIMTCAPRFARTRDTNITSAEGRCAYIKPTSSSKNSPRMTLRAMSHGYLRNEYHRAAYPDFKEDRIPSELLMDSLGWSSHVNNDNNILVGGPAMSIGRVIKYEDVSRTPHIIPVKNAELSKNSLQVTFNFGYSMTSLTDDENKYYAISTPYGTFGNGRVLLYSQSDPAELPDSIQEGEVNSTDSVGSLYGAALAVLQQGGVDAALLVGAPAFAPEGSVNNSQRYDVGAVYIYQYSEFGFQRKLELHRIMVGYTNAGYFGHAIVSLGDQNLDGVDEMAISAPYENDGRGVVYIYSGLQLLSNDPEVPCLQKIEAEGSPDQHFGRSLYALQDADDNGCNELAIGVPGNNSVLLLRCIASVQVNFDANFPDLTDQAAKLQTSNSSFDYNICLNVNYTHPDKPNPIETVISITISINHPTVEIRNAVNGSITFLAELRERRSQYCNSITVLLPREGDYDQPIEFSMVASANENPLNVSKYNSGLVFVDGEKTLIKAIPTYLMPESNLTYHISTSLKNYYLIGSTKNETMTLTIRNDGNKAYGACIRVRVRGLQDLQVVGELRRVCEHSGDLLTCTPNPPLDWTHKDWNVTVTMVTEELSSANETVEIHAEILKHCKTKTGEPYNNTILLKSDLDVQLRGMSLPSPQINATQKELKEKGKQIEHIYYISNNGMTRGKNLVCEIILPTDPDIKCTVYEGANECTVNSTAAVCVVKDLSQGNTIIIRVQMDIRPVATIISEIMRGAAYIVTHFQINLGKDVKRKSITTEISLWDPSVPIWIIIVASLVGLLILLIVGWILHEFGCLKRSKKEELLILKNEVKRQSMRRSKMLRESTIEVVRDDLQKLVEEPEDSDEKSHNEEVNADPARSAFAAELSRAVRKDTHDPFSTKADFH